MRSTDDGMIGSMRTMKTTLSRGTDNKMERGVVGVPLPLALRLSGVGCIDRIAARALSAGDMLPPVITVDGDTKVIAKGTKVTEVRSETTDDF